MNYFATPIFIISFNRLGYLQQLVQWLEQAGYTNLHIIDNASTYPPLLRYLAQSPHQVHHMDKNYGHLVLWESGQFDAVIQSQPFVLTDCDVLPAQGCPHDVVAYLAQQLAIYTNKTKVGLSLRIDDLPDHYALKDQVIEWETPFWAHRLPDAPLFDAAIDTTFAYYRPNIPPSDPKWWRALRTDAPYTAHHLPWYVDSSQPLTEEDLFYQRHVKAMSSQWSTTDAEALKVQNIELMKQINALRAEIYVLKQPLWSRAYLRLRPRLVRGADALGLGRWLRALRNRLRL